MTTIKSRCYMPIACFFKSLLLWLVPISCNASNDLIPTNPDNPPEVILGISLDLKSAEPESISVEEARMRTAPIVKALQSSKAKERHAALRLIAECFQEMGSDKPTKYTMMGHALRIWAGFSSYYDTPAPKSDRQAFIACVNVMIDMYGKEHGSDAGIALYFFVDLELQIQKNDNSVSLLEKWKNSVTYRNLMERE